MGKKIKDEGLNKYIAFLGEKTNLREYFSAGDLFYLSSREDPFPLVSLEAAACSLPTICFADAGGMPEFVKNDAGYVVTYEDIDTVADKIAYLIDNPKVLQKLGECAKEKMLAHYTVDTAGPQILMYFRKVGNIKPLVSVILPNYNYARYLPQRLESIYNQTFQDFEVIILDDCSTDNSLEVIEKYSDRPSTSIIVNKQNSGNVFKQWDKGLKHAKGEIIWIAEADDYCQPEFLETVLPKFADRKVSLAYANSYVVDDENTINGDYTPYYNCLDPYHWNTSYIVSAEEEINYGLGVKNTIPNVSAVLFRKDSLLNKITEETLNYTFSGDWFTYIQVIKNNKIAFCVEKLNFHRKHKQTVTNKMQQKNHRQVILYEAASIHEIVLRDFKIDSEYMNKWDRYFTGQIYAWYPTILEDDLHKFYTYNLTKEKINNAIIKSEQNRRLIFLTTNDGSADGGSEQLYIESAKECKKRGYDVMIVIKNWDPVPNFIQEFYDIGIKVLFKGHDEFKQVLLFKPDLLVVSTGDQDEGIEWYEHCQKYKIPYVIINQLTKEPEYWPIKRDINEQVKNGYLGAARVFFTCNNNHEVMEKRLNCKIPKASIHYNPFHVDRNSFVPFPPVDDGLKIAIPANLSRVHKGQDLALELFNLKKWRERPIQLNLYGKGYDEEVLKAMAKKYGLKKVFFHNHTNDLLTIWRDNHAIFLPSFMEGLPLVLVSAMICARVPILTDIGAHRELIDDNINGFIAKKPTVEALEEALERAYQKSEIWEDMGQKARERILSYLPPNDPVDDFISRIIPLSYRKK